jgi:TPR repeat protein
LVGYVVRHIMRVALVCFLLVACSSSPPPAPRARPTRAPVVEHTADAPRPSKAEPSCETVASTNVTAIEFPIRVWLESKGKPEAAERLALTCTGEIEFRASRTAVCVVAGVMLETGNGVGRDPVRAVDLFMRTVGDGVFDMGGCHFASPAFHEGVRGFSSGCHGLATPCPRGCESDCAAMLERLRRVTVGALDPACAAGNAGACLLSGYQYALGSYFHGLGYVVDQDADRAEKMFTRACTLGVGLACDMQALYFRFRSDADGNSTADLAAARRLYKRGCDLGSGAACIDHARNLDPPENKDDTFASGPMPAAALAIYERACTLGMRGICADLGEMFLNGERVPRDARKAERFTRLSK